MGLNIKNDEAHRLARELADLTGESLTAAVTVAVRERRDRIRATSAEGIAKQLVAIGRDCASRLPASVRDLDHDDLLYDDDGLPR